MIPTHPLRSSLTGCLLLIGSVVAASAQPPAAAPTAQASEETLRLTTFVVTGSNLPTAADASDVPIVVIGRHDVEKSGIDSNVLELLRKSIPAFAGRSNAGNSNGSNTNQATGGGSQISLRNLPTLVLVNGRRVTYSSINGSGGKNFVDVNMFPLAAIDRVEVLTDGASAIYGSDAIGGVVNIILKADYSGGEIGSRYAVTNNAGHYGERSAYAVYGAKNKAVALTVSGSWSKTDPLLQSQRPFSAANPKAATNFPGIVGGNYLKPGLNSPSQSNPTGTGATATGMADLVANGTYLAAGSAAIPPFNVAPYTNILIAQEQKSAAADFSARLIGEKLVAFGDLVYSRTNSSNQIATALSNVIQLGVTVPAGSPYNPLTVAAPGVVVGTADTPQRTLNNTRAYRGTLGLRGQINADWNWEAGYTYSSSKLNQQFTNTVFAPSFAAAIAGGYDASGNAVAGGKFSKVIGGLNINGPLVLQPALDPFARSGLNPASLANVYGTEVAKTAASLGGFDAKVVGMPFSLPAGKVGFAVGVATRKETLSGTPDQNSYNASTDPTKHNWRGGAFFFDPFSQSRTVDSYFGELRAPITSPTWNFLGAHALDLSLAARSEKYSDVGKSGVPKIGFRWQPYDKQFTLRFSYSKSFAAPFLIDEYGPPSFAFGPGVGAGLNPGVNYFSGNGNNPDLKPSQAWSRSAGAVLSPNAIKGLTVSVNYVNVFQKGFQAGVGALTIINSVNQLGAASPFFSAVAVGNAPGQPGATRAPLAAPGGFLSYLNSPTYGNDFYILDYKINSGGVHAEAVDLNFDYELPTAQFGRFTFSSAGNYLISSKVSPIPDSPFHQFAGYSTNANLLAGSAAKWSFYSSVDWKLHQYELQVGNSYRSSMTDISSGIFSDVWLATNPPTTVSYYTTWDLQASYTVSKVAANSLWSYLNGAKITLGVNNVFNRMPPSAPLSQSFTKGNNNGVDVATYSPIGRLFYVSASVKF